MTADAVVLAAGVPLSGTHTVIKLEGTPSSNEINPKLVALSL